MTIEQKFGKTVASLRKANGISQEKFALEAGVSPRYMTDVENGKRHVSIDIVEKIAKQLDLSISQLFAEVEKTEK